MNKFLTKSRISFELSLAFIFLEEFTVFSSPGVEPSSKSRVHVSSHGHRSLRGSCSKQCPVPQHYRWRAVSQLVEGLRFCCISQLVGRSLHLQQLGFVLTWSAVLRRCHHTTSVNDFHNHNIECGLFSYLFLYLLRERQRENLDNTR